MSHPHFKVFAPDAQVCVHVNFVYILLIYFVCPACPQILIRGRLQLGLRTRHTFQRAIFFVSLAQYLSEPPFAISDVYLEILQIVGSSPLYESFGDAGGTQSTKFKVSIQPSVTDIMLSP